MLNYLTSVDLKAKGDSKVKKMKNLNNNCSHCNDYRNFIAGEIGMDFPPIMLKSSLDS